MFPCQGYGASLTLVRPWQAVNSVVYGDLLHCRAHGGLFYVP